MEALNESSKKVAKARKLILEYLTDQNVRGEKLHEAAQLLEEALNKLTDKM